MGNLAIPCQALNVVGSGRCVSQPEGVLDIIDIVNEELAFGAGSSQDLGSQRVELQCLDSAGVFGGLGNESIRGT